MRTKVKGKFIKRSDNVPHREVQGELLLLNVIDGSYFGLNKTGELIWKMLDGTKTVPDIIEALKGRFNLGENTAKKHLNDFLRELKRYNLIEFPSSKR